MDLRRLHYFVAVAEELHFTRAAARVKIAQPALSQHIRALEQELGLQLFARTSRSVELTNSGRVLLDHAHRILADVDRAERAVRRAEQGDLGRLVIGVGPESSSGLPSELISSYYRQHPNVDIVLRRLRLQEQVDALIEGQIDVGLIILRVEHPRIRLTAVEHRRFVVAMPATHRLAARQSLRLAELANERWLNTPAHPGVLYTACAKEGFEPLFSEQATDHTTRLSLVAAGIGVTLMFESAPRMPSRHVVYRPLDPKLTMDLLAAWREDHSSPLVDGFLDIAQTWDKAAVESPST